MEQLNTALLIDDDPINNFLSYAVLTRTGIVKNIQIENSGINALLYLQNYYLSTKTLPELIFLDLNMPLMDGLQFLRAFKDEFFMLQDKVEIIILSNAVNEGEKSEATKLGVTHCIIKPLSEDIIKELIPRVLRTSLSE